MAVIWKINGYTLDELGITDLKITFANHADDVATWTCDGTDVDATPDHDFPVGTDIAITRAENVQRRIIFQGRITATPRQGSGTASRIAYEARGGWYWLGKVFYTQPWKAGESGTQSKTRVILGYNPSTGAPWSGDSQIAHILACAAAKAPIAAGTVSTLSMVLPADEEVDLTCADAINRVLAWAPDTAVWCDHSQSTPVLHFRKIDGSQAGDVRNIEVHPVQGAESLQIVPRHDLVVPGVEIVYEITSANQSGKRFRDVVVDNGGWNGTTGAAGDPDALGAAHFTIQLDGGSVRQLYQSVTTRLLPGCASGSTSPTSVEEGDSFDPHDFPDWADFICDHIPELDWLLGPGTEISITSISPPIPPTKGNIPLDHELLRGEIQPWMKNKIAEKRTIEITVDYTDDDGTEVKGRVFRVDFTATNAESGLYSFLESRQSAEDIPQNLAARLYAAVGRLYHEGRVTFVSDSVRDFYVNPSNANPGGPIHPGHLLNLTATNRSAWSSMRTPVQSVELDIATGRTTLAFGPPEHLGPQDLVQLAQANRKRASVRSLAAWSTAEAETEEPSVGGPGALSRAGRSMPGHTMKTVIGEDSGHGRVILDATDSTIAGGASTTVKPGLLVLRAGPGNNDPSLTLDPSAGGASNDLYTLDGLDVKVTGSLARGINVEVELYRKKVTIANGFVTAVETASSISDSDSVS